MTNSFSNVSALFPVAQPNALILPVTENCSFYHFHYTTYSTSLLILLSESYKISVYYLQFVLEIYFVTFS